MTDEQYLFLKDKLSQMRRELLEGMDNHTKHSNDEFEGEVSDLNDEANRTYNRQVLLSLGEVERQQLKLIDEALELLEIPDSGYGVCIDCEEDIPFERLAVAPYVKRCIECKTMYEEQIKAED